LFVRPNGSKLWRIDYSILGKRKTMALGNYPVVDLKTARTKSDKDSSGEQSHADILGANREGNFSRWFTFITIGHGSYADCWAI